MPSLKLTQFGGIAPRQRPNNLHQAMAQVAHDVDLSRGTLPPWRTDKKVSDKTGNSIFVDKCCYLTSDNCKASYSRIDTDCCFIVASGVKDYPVIQRKDNACNDKWNRLGFPIELDAPNAQFLGTLSQDFNQELRQYIYTLVDEFGFESAPSLPSEPIYAHNDQQVILSGLPKLTVSASKSQIIFTRKYKLKRSRLSLFVQSQCIVATKTNSFSQPQTVSFNGT